jgi:hypothetical protein
MESVLAISEVGRLEIALQLFVTKSDCTHTHTYKYFDRDLNW